MESNVQAVPANLLQSEDFSRICLNIGIDIGKDAPWVQFDNDDLKILYKLLTMEIDGNPICSQSEALGVLASFVSCALRWVKSHPDHADHI